MKPYILDKSDDDHLVSHTRGVFIIIRFIIHYS